MNFIKLVFWLLLINLNISSVEGRNIELDIALRDVNERLKAAMQDAKSTTPTPSDYIDSYVPMTTLPPSESSSITMSTPAVLAIDPDNQYTTQPSMYRQVLNQIAAKCTVDNTICRELESEVHQIFADHGATKGMTDPTALEILGSVFIILISLSLLSSGLVGLLLVLDKLFPSDELASVVGWLVRRGEQCVEIAMSVMRRFGRPADVGLPAQGPSVYTEELRRGYLEFLASQSADWESSSRRGRRATSVVYSGNQVTYNYLGYSRGLSNLSFVTLKVIDMTLCCFSLGLLQFHTFLCIFIPDQVICLR